MKFRNILMVISLILSGQVFADNKINYADLDKDPCKDRKVIDIKGLRTLNIAIKQNRQDLVDKLLFKQCFLPVKPDSFGAYDDLFLVTNSIESYKKLSLAGGNNFKKDMFGMGFYENLFSYHRVNVLPKEYQFFLKTNYKRTHKEMIPGYFKMTDFDKIDYTRLVDNETYTKYLKYIIDINPTKKILENNKGEGYQMGITPLHYAVYNGNYELFIHLKDRLKDKYNPNILNKRGQPLLAVALNHYCFLDKTGKEGLKKIIKDLLEDTNTDMSISFKVNNELNIQVMPDITFQDLLVYYKSIGDKEVYDYIIELIKENKKDFFANYDESMPLHKAITADSMKAGLCLDVRTENYDYPDK